MYLDSCAFFGTHNRHTTRLCPTRLASATVDNYIAKLKAIFTSLSMLDHFDIPSSSLSFGNPAFHPIISNYLKSIREEQAQARVTPKQAVPLFFDKFLALCNSIKASLLQQDISPTTRYIYAQDLAFFCLDFYSGDRASDLGRLKTSDVICLPDQEGLLFRHTFGKTLHGKHTRMFAVKPSSSPCSCPVANLKLYVLLCDRMRINLRQGFLFRTTDPKGCVINTPFLGYAVANRLKKYLSNLHLDDSETAHSFRAGCSITLSLLGASNEAIAKHVSWRSVATAAYYTQTDTVMQTRTSALLTADHSALSASQDSPMQRLGATFRVNNNLQGFSLAFP